MSQELQNKVNEVKNVFKDAVGREIDKVNEPTKTLITRFMTDPKSVIKEIYNEIDTNHDGKLEINEVFSWNTMQVIFGIILTILTWVLLTYVKAGVLTGDWRVDNMLTMLSILVPITLITWVYKGVMDLINKNYRTEVEKLKKIIEEKEAKIKKQADTITENKIEILQLKADIRQLEDKLKWYENGDK